MNPEDQRDIDETLAGKTDAFERLVIRYQDRLLGSLTGLLGSVEDAHDAAQQAFINAYKKLKSFKGDSAFYSWLFRIAYNAAISQIRKNRMPSTSLDELRDGFGAETASESVDDAPAHGLEVEETQACVRRAVAELSEEFRVPLVLKEIEGMRYEEIAELVGCPIGTVRSRIHRARVELRDKLRLLIAPEDLPELPSQRT